MSSRTYGAVAAKLIHNHPDEPGRFRFAHALIRESLYEDLMPAERIRLHREVGQALETTYASNPEPHIEELAYHFFEAAPGGDVRKAVEYSMSAGSRYRPFRVRRSGPPLQHGIARAEGLPG